MKSDMILSFPYFCTVIAIAAREAVRKTPVFTPPASESEMESASAHFRLPPWCALSDSAQERRETGRKEEKEPLLVAAIPPHLMSRIGAVELRDV